ncbi:MAG: DNA primase [Pyrinomonadaceae bacterium]
MHFDQFFIDDLKSRADIVRIIEPHTTLKKKGANWMGRCPFHQEKTPSFSVNPAKGFYKCFGCGKGGSVIDFLMETEGLSFPEAIIRVAEITGIPIPEPIDDVQFQKKKKKRDEQRKLSDQVVGLNLIALEFWELELNKTSVEAIAAREYLKSRGISEETQKTFRIGFSPDSWDALLIHLRSVGVDERQIEQSGLVSINKEKERVFDRFRGRIIFPVLDVNGNPVAFGARALNNDQPKYLNSPETPAYIKGDHLYGLFQASSEIKGRGFAILVEGYLDLIALHQNGIKNVTASLGTSLTANQSKLLSRYTRNVVINYDGDSAGIMASRRAIGELLPNNFDIKVLVLPNGMDPDDFIRENGSKEYSQFRKNAQLYLQFVLDHSVKGRDLASVKQKTEAIGDVLEVVSKIGSGFQKQESFSQTMEFFRIQDSAFRRDLWKTVESNQNPAPVTIKQKIRKVTQSKSTVAEQLLLELIIYDKELRGLILPRLEPSDFESLATASIYRSLIALNSTDAEVSRESLLELIEDDEYAEDFIGLLFIGEPRRDAGEVIDEVLHAAENCVFTLRLMAITDFSLEVGREIILAEQSGDLARLGQLVGEQVKLGKMKREFQHKLTKL